MTHRNVINSKRIVNSFMLLLLCVCLVFVMGGCLISNVDIQNEPVIEEAFPEEDFSSMYAELDYSGLVATMQHYFYDISNCFMSDSDGNGMPELFVSAKTYNDDLSATLGFDLSCDYKVRIITHDLSYQDAGWLMRTPEGKAILRAGYYSVDGTNDSYYRWNNGTWEEFANIQMYVDYEQEGGETVVTEAYYENETDIKTEELFFDKLDQANLDWTETDHTLSTTKKYTIENVQQFMTSYEKHLTDEYGCAVYYNEADFDDDGNNEYAFVINNYVDKWLSNCDGEGIGYDRLYHDICAYNPYGGVVIYADTYGDEVIFSTFYNKHLQFDVENFCELNVYWESGTLYVDLDTLECAEWCRFFAPRCELIFNRDNDKSIEKEFWNQYADYLINESRANNKLITNVWLKSADIYAINGADIDEIVCVYKQQGKFWITIGSVYLGQVHTLFKECNQNKTAYYIIKSDNGVTKHALLTYYQELFSKGGAYWNRYQYSVLEYNIHSKYEQNTSYTVEVRYGDESESAVSKLKIINELLKTAMVCVDPFCITGYDVMPDSITKSTSDNTQKYLSISNCNRNKTGIVDIRDDDSWLNFREGPSTKQNRVALTVDNKKVYVKQLKGSHVTVIDTVNTGDEKNPIWAKIQIKYSNRTLVGYSSQKYINIPDIKHISMGESFVVTAQTNDSGIVWSSNDTSVLAIDESTGRAVGIKKGLVLITVRSSSGLTDSCLIMVD